MYQSETTSDSEVNVLDQFFCNGYGAKDKTDIYYDRIYAVFKAEKVMKLFRLFFNAFMCSILLPY